LLGFLLATSYALGYTRDLVITKGISYSEPLMVVF
jgi:hypothetical protein